MSKLLESDDLERIIKTYGSLEEYYEHFRASPQGGCGDEEDIPQELEKTQDPQSSWARDDPPSIG